MGRFAIITTSNRVKADEQPISAATSSARRRCRLQGVCPVGRPAYPKSGINRYPSPATEKLRRVLLLRGYVWHPSQSPDFIASSTAVPGRGTCSTLPVAASFVLCFLSGELVVRQTGT